MIEELQKYFENLLKGAGSNLVYTFEKDIKDTSPPKFAAIFPLVEELEKSKDKAIIKKSEESEVKRIEKFKRNTTFRLIIADINYKSAEKIYTNFLSEFSEFIKNEDGTYTGFEILKADWENTEDTILKSKILLSIEVLAKTSIYKDYEIKNVTWKGDGEYV